MSEQSVALALEPLGLAAAAAAAFRAPAAIRADPAAWVFIFVPDLTSAELATFTALVADYTQAAATRALGLSLAEWQRIKDDAAGLKTYLGLASPTNAQTVAAVKAIVRVLGAMLRD